MPGWPGGPELRSPSQNFTETAPRRPLSGLESTISPWLDSLARAALFAASRRLSQKISPGGVDVSLTPRKRDSNRERDNFADFSVSACCFLGALLRELHPAQ